MLLKSSSCDFNWQAPDFTLPDLHGNPVSLAQSCGDHGLLIAFICNHCPYVQAIIGRLVADAKLLHADGINTIAIMPNDFAAYAGDSPAEMQQFAKQHNFFFPYLLDEEQQVARAYAAVCTPDFFGFNRDCKLQYRGRLDDAKMDSPAKRNAELLDAMRGLAETGQGPTQQTASMGCSIKWR